MFNDPVIEQFRLNANGKSYTGVFTLAYPNMTICIVLGFTSTQQLKLSQVKALINHVKSTGRKEIIFYRERSNKEIEKRIKL